MSAIRAIYQKVRKSLAGPTDTNRPGNPEPPEVIEPEVISAGPEIQQEVNQQPVEALPPPKIAKPLKPGCARCRSLDHVREELRIANVLQDEADRAKVNLWALPSVDGLRFAIDQSEHSSFIAGLQRTCNDLNIDIATTSTEMTNNIYEFDQVDFVGPTKAVTLHLSPRPHCNRGKTYLPRRGISLELVESRGDVVVIPSAGLGPRIYSQSEMDTYRVRSPLQSLAHDWPFPIDLVFTWVDKDDDIWRQNFEKVAHELEAYDDLTASTNAARWHSRDELLYSLRSIEMYAPFVRKIFIVTNGQRPKWLEDNARIEIVTHADLYPDASDLPTFNSNHIETVLHLIPGLAEHFLYLNDDFFFAGRCTPADFFTMGGLGKVFFSIRHLDALPLGVNDRSTVAAHKNCRDVLQKHFGVKVYRKFRHAPYVMRKSVWDAIEQSFPQELAATRHHRFRSRQDLNGQFLYAHYALLSGAAFEGRIEYGYIDIQDAGFKDALQALESKRIKVFCLNDANSQTENIDKYDGFIRKYLKTRFPKAAVWEAEDYWDEKRSVALGIEQSGSTTSMDIV